MNEARAGKVILVRELDVVSGVIYACGKDGRLYRLHDIGAAQLRADRGEPAARAALAIVDFGVDDAGVEVDDAAVDRAIQGFREAWERGDFDDLCELGELLPDTHAATWIGAARARRERREAGVRNRSRNTSMVPSFRSPDDWARARPPGSFTLAGDELRAALRAAGFDDRAG